MVIFPAKAVQAWKRALKSALKRPYDDALVCPRCGYTKHERTILIPPDTCPSCGGGMVDAKEK